MHNVDWVMFVYSQLLEMLKVLTKLYLYILLTYPLVGSYVSYSYSLVFHWIFNFWSYEYLAFWFLFRVVSTVISGVLFACFSTVNCILIVYSFLVMSLTVEARNERDYKFLPSEGSSNDNTPKTKLSRT